MFQGTCPADVRSILLPVMQRWGCTDLAFPCSGNFTVPRALTDFPGRLHGNDVTLYSCALGAYYAGGEFAVRVEPDLDLEWLEEHLATPEGRTAAVMVWSDHAQAWIKRGRNPYYARVARAARAQFPRMHAEATAKLVASKLKLASFFAGDCVDFVLGLGPEVGILSFPPVYRSGYERMWKYLDECFAWDPPAYEVFDDARMQVLLDAVCDRPHWILGAQSPIEGLDPHLVGVARATNRAPEFWMYASRSAARHLVTPHQNIEPLLVPNLGDDEEIGDDLELRFLSPGEFAGLRSHCLNPGIAPGAAGVMMALLADGKLVGVCAFNRPSGTVNMAGVDRPYAYMMTDFPVRPTRYPRLSKLVVAAALSRECQFLLERKLGCRYRSVVTTAFSDRPASMKYRGLMKLLCRTESEPGEHFKYRLNYGAPLGRLTLAESLARWEKTATAASPEEATP
jgi:hypothetical protein